MRRSFSPLIGLLIAALVLAAVPAAFAAAPSGFPFKPDPQPISGPAVDSDIGAPIDFGGPIAIPAPPDDAVAAPRPEHFGPTGSPGGPLDARPALDRPIDRPDVPNEIKARCVGSVRDTGEGSVECNWTAREDLDVAGWQLWKIMVRPEHGERALVAELRPEVTTFVDTDVEVPAHYLYAVLAIDADGEIIARSAVAPASLNKPPGHDEGLRLKCRPVGPHDRPSVDTSLADIVPADAKPIDVAPPNFEPSIGCEWSPAQVDTAVGYVLWRQVDGGERVTIARTGLDLTRFVDTDVASGHRYVYVATAVDAAGEVVARSHAEHVGIPGPRPRPVPPIHTLPEPGLPPVVPRPPVPADPSSPKGPTSVDPPPIGNHPKRPETAPAIADRMSPAPATTAPASPAPTTTAPAMPRTSASG